MTDYQDFLPDNSKSGMIFYWMGTYTPYTGWENSETGQQITYGWNFRAFFAFDTSVIPDHARVKYVAFFFRRQGDPLGSPEFYLLRISIGQFIGSSLDGTAEEWNGGEDMVALDERPADKYSCDLTQDGNSPFGHINKFGYTDVKVWDDSTQGSGDPQWATVFNLASDAVCQLVVAWTFPIMVATGEGSASMSATVRAASSATVTGVGSATMSASVHARAGATASGDGEATMGASVRAALTAAATGVGFCETAARTAHLMAASASGFGTGSLGSRLRHRGAATLTGYGSALLTLVAVMEPLAVHSAVRSVSPTDSATRSLSSGHSATRACEPDSAATRGARRLS